ncbi:sigma factor-like helix-turn-helix DNA-binding protein [Gordonia iterans]
MQVRPIFASIAPQRTKQKQVRLSGQQRQDLVDRYRAGALQRELAAVYGIHVETVRAIIRRAQLQA